MTPSALDLLAAALFTAALLHTFSVSRFHRLAQRFPRHAGLLHLLGEVEVVFGLWAAVLVVAMAALLGGGKALAYLATRSYTEPLFVFVVMVVAASRPILQGVEAAMDGLAHRLSRFTPLPAPLALAWLGLAAVPLLGSAITEPAAMTLAALLLAPRVFRPQVPEAAKYLALGVLFVNISIGGTLTAFAAPPVLMVAATWQWDSAFMLTTLGWKAAIAVGINATLATLVLRRHLQASPPAEQPAGARAPLLVQGIHLAFLAGVVGLAHHPVAFVGLFMLFLGFTQAYARHQGPLVLREALLVAVFLAGLVVLGGLQQWWLQPIVAGLSPQALFYGATALTAVTDNAALTYLGSLINGIPLEAQVSLVAGAVTGGGLTLVANAPNPAGAALLRRGFGGATIGAGGLLLGALAPTLVAMAAFTLL